MRVLLVLLHPSLSRHLLTLRTVWTPDVPALGRGASASPLAEGVLHSALVVTVHTDLGRERVSGAAMEMQQKLYEQLDRSPGTSQDTHTQNRGQL